MRSLNPLVWSRLGRRLAGLLAVGSLLPLLLLAVFQAHEQVGQRRAQQLAALAADSQALAQAVAARVAAADSLAAVLVSAHSGVASEVLRAAVRDSGVFASLRMDSADLEALPLVKLRGAEHRSALVALPRAADGAVVYIARRLGTGNGVGTTLAYFEIAPAWLWQDFDSAQRDALVVDSHGTLLRRATAVIDAPYAASVAEDATVAAARREPRARALAWTVRREEWQGQAAPLRGPSTLQIDAPWTVAVHAPAPQLISAAASLWAPPLAAATLAVVLLLAGVLALARRYLPALYGLQAAVGRVGRSDWRPLDVARHPDELRGVAAAINSAAARLDDEVRALQMLADIDRELLGATELEPVLDSILRRVNGVTRCDTVGIALLDTDSPTHARVYVAAAAPLDLPVARVEFDPDMIDSLVAADEAITVARCEELRHSFLAPLRELGSEFFWVWPMIVGSRLAAVLTIGFADAPAADPIVARRGAGFAERLAIALSKTAREERLYRQAHFDPLTSLPNRLLFRDRLEQELAAVSDGRARGALLYIDLDHFKRVNDSVGHAAGDQLLQIVAQRLRACVKEGDTVSRLAGDEFTVILRNVADSESAAVVAERIIDSIRVPVNLGGRDHFVQASIGIALFPDDGAAIDDLLRNADRAMYRAKELGRGRAVFFDRRLMLSRFETSHSGLYRALRRREFSLYYQPQYSLADGSLVGLEALLRWQTPRDGTRSPQEFIPAAETSGLIVDIGGWVLDAACSQFAIWREQGIAPARFAVNVSVQQLKSADFARSVRRVLDKYGIQPSLLEIEMTETVFADDAAGAAMRQLAELGVRLALDDFGTGYSSLNYLRQHPIHVIKIDRSFLEEVPGNDSSSTLAGTIISMAHALGKEVVAEGVERVEQLDFLRERGCDIAQGFYLAQPLPVADVTALLAARRGRDGDGVAEPMREAG
jgi:diguanylate cyclase (GGDEF)-like protein